MTTFLNAISPYLWEIFVIIVGSIGTYLATKVVPLIEAKFKETMHSRGFGVVADSLWIAVSRMSRKVAERFANGSLDETDVIAIRAEARSIAIDKLERLSGFTKDNLGDWVDEQLDVLTGKLTQWASGSQKDDD